MAVLGSVLDEDGNIDKSKVDGITSKFRNSPPEDLVSDLTPPMWQRIEGKRYTYAVPQSWDTKVRKPDYRAETFAIDTIEKNGFFANIHTMTVSVGDLTPIEVAANSRARAKKNGATNVAELSPFVVSNDGDATGYVFPFVYNMEYEGVTVTQYTAVVDIGGDSALVVTIAGRNESLRTLSKRIMNTFIVWD